MHRFHLTLQLTESFLSVAHVVLLNNLQTKSLSAKLTIMNRYFHLPKSHTLKMLAFLQELTVKYLQRLLYSW